MFRKLQIICCVLAMLPFSAIGQVVINNSIFPKPGDTLNTITDNSFTDFDTAMIGANVTWDFRGLSGGFVNQIVFLDPTEGTAFDTFVSADLLDISTGQEIYYETQEDKIIEVGRTGLDPVLGAIDLTFMTEGESVLRRAPMQMGDVFESESGFFIKSSTEIIPDSILAPLGPIAATIDSMRLRVTTGVTETVDAWGTLMLPEGEYPAVRVKTETTTNVELGAHNILLGWLTIDPSNPLFAGLGDLLDLLGASTVVTYQFYSNDNKERMANVFTDEERMPAAATYKGRMATSTKVIRGNESDVVTYPNPTFGDINFELVNYPQDEYKVYVYNIIGKKLWSSKIDPNTQRVSANLSHLQKGTYLYSIINSRGQKMTTRRLMIITP